ncbi:hypothetical protein PWYN_24610 [Paenibacillus wynnii]|uniref:Uncharacterized protein n=1 Tax=Paenibacillus wynnii TaxID=268407 RepID=A0A098M5A5_9BACL|nr:hypothetical protein PWYN_24610 [Paenibacillus wynnii]
MIWGCRDLLFVLMHVWLTGNDSSINTRRQPARWIGCLFIKAISQYRLGNALSDILHYIDVENPAKREEFPIDESKLKECCGTYLKDKIQVELINGKLYFTRFVGNLHIEIYPVGEGLFVRRYCDQVHPYSIAENENGKMTFLGYVKDKS